MFNTLPRTAIRRSRNSIKLKLEDRRFSKLQRRETKLGGAERWSSVRSWNAKNEGTGLEMEVIDKGKGREEEVRVEEEVQVEEERVEERNFLDMREVEEDAEVKVERDAALHALENKDENAEAKRNIELDFGIRERDRGREREKVPEEARIDKSQERSFERRRKSRIAKRQTLQHSRPATVKDFLSKGLLVVVKCWGYQDLLPYKMTSPPRYQE